MYGITDDYQIALTSLQTNLTQVHAQREQLREFLDRMAFPERYPESESNTWHSGDGPFEAYAEGVLDEYRELVKKGAV